MFVEADAQKKIQRLYWVQFEAFLPDNERVYKYPFIEKTTCRAQPRREPQPRPYQPQEPARLDRERVFAMVA